MKIIKTIIPLMFSLLLLLCQIGPVLSVQAEENTGENAEEKILPDLDFSSGRILVKTEDESLFANEPQLLSSYETVYLLQYESPEQAKEAYAYYLDKAEAVEVDTDIFIAEDADFDEDENPPMSPEDNPFTEAERTLPMVQGSYDIALIDTGANAQLSVSVTGAEPYDDNGHGQQMADCIYEQNPNAVVLSIKALGANGRGNASDLYAALKLAMSCDVRIINLSLSAMKSADSEIIEEAIKEACAKGITVVGAAGNNGRNAEAFLPGSVEEAIVLGAANKDGSRISISNYGSTVDYNVVAEATSNAAAKMSGWLSFNDLNQIPEILNQGFIYDTNYAPEAEGQKEETKEEYSVCLSEQVGIRFSFTDEQGEELESGSPDETLKRIYLSGEEVYVKAVVEDGFLLSSTQVVMADEYQDTRIVEAQETMLGNGAYLYHFAMPKADTMIGSLLFQKSADDAEAAAYGFGPGSLTTKPFDQIKPNLKSHSGFSYLGLPYVSPCSGLVNWNAKTASGFDCSGYVNAMVHWFYDDGSFSYPYTGEAFASAWWKPALQSAGLWVCGGTSAAEIRSQVAAGKIRPGDIIVFGDYVHVAIVYEVSGNDAQVIHAYSSNVQCNWLASEVWAWDGAGINSANDEFQTSGSGYYYRYDVYRGTGNDGYLKLHKDSADTGITGGNGAYSLKGAVYTVYQGSKAVGTLTTDANGDTNTLKLPVGAYTVKETTAANNYELDSRTYNVNITSSHTTSSPYLLKVSDQPLFDKMSIRIIKESTHAYATAFQLDGAQFVVKYFDNTEGDVSKAPKRTWKIKTVKDEQSGAYTAALDDPESLLTEESDPLYLVSGKVILPVGTYLVEEVKPAPGYTLTGASLIAEDGSEIALDEGRYIGVVRKVGDGVHLTYGNLYTMKNTPIEVHTMAVNQKDSSHYAQAGEAVTIVDTVTMAGTDCERLVNDNGEWDYIKYRLKGEVHDLETGELLASASKDFITDDFDGHVESLKFKIKDTSKLAGHTIYVSEYLYSYVTINEGKGKKHDEETLVACEDETIFPDLSDGIKETQRIHFPNLFTTLLNDANQTHIADALGTLSLTDTVTYEGLIPGVEYEIRGQLMNKKNGQTAMDKDGNEITTSMRFVPEQANGVKKLNFRFENSELAGETLVAFEELFEGDKKIAGHEDIEDEEQSVHLTPIHDDSETPKTGDSNNPLIWLLLSGGALSSLISLSLVMLRKKHSS